MELHSTEDLEILLGEQIRSVRIAQQLNQHELAARANVSPNSVSALERGEGSTIRTLVRVARALDRTEWLSSFDPIGDGPSPMDLLRTRRNEPVRRQRVSRSR
ncbi:MAG TPA: helix-turn-helix transcriptional regulator [Pseudolysinimonas sp.]|nr:helix-turn-helix transcriptional regulator [Pseudolysinimonas sp.]